MERIDYLENQVITYQNNLKDLMEGREPKNISQGKSQNLKDKEIIEFFGENDSDF